jgi:c-di-GMP-binding flagellar brake protein YcgR
MWQLLKKFVKTSNQLIEIPDDRRKMARIRMLLTINCQSYEHEEPFRIMTENINILGIKYISAVKLYVGEVVDMKILLHSNFPHISLKGRVVWCEKKNMYGKTCYEGGIEFTAINEEDRKYLDKFIEKYKVDDFEPAV